MARTGGTSWCSSRSIVLTTASLKVVKITWFFCLVNVGALGIIRLSTNEAINVPANMKIKKTPETISNIVNAIIGKEWKGNSSP